MIPCRRVLQKCYNEGEKGGQGGRIDTTYIEFVTADFLDQIGDLIELCFENGFPTCTKSLIVRIMRFEKKKGKQKN